LIFTGSVLLALLFIADWYMPQLAAPSAQADVDRSTIRLRSQHKWPERIVIDTSLPTIVLPPANVVEIPPFKAPPVARSPREAFAQVTPVQAAAPATAPKTVQKRRTQTARTGGHVANFDSIGFRNTFPGGW
jgi:hypothetical protein